MYIAVGVSRCASIAVPHYAAPYRPPVLRFAPAPRWMAVVSHILTFVSSGAWKPPSAGVSKLWVPSVTASFSRDEKLPADAEKQALIRGVQFYRNAR